MKRAHHLMEAFLKRELATSKLRCLGRSSGGCISDGQSYETESGRVFVKHNIEDKVCMVSIYPHSPSLVLKLDFTVSQGERSGG